MMGACSMQDAWALLERIEEINARMDAIRSDAYPDDEYQMALDEEYAQLDEERKHLEGLCT